MKLLLWDSRPGNRYIDIDGSKVNGHRLELEANWPIIIASSWKDFQKKASESSEPLCAFMIHISDAQTIPDARTEADQTSQIVSCLKASGHGNEKPIIFFSGGRIRSDYVRALADYAGFVQSCDLSDAKKLLHTFGATNECSLFGINDSEVVLECLSGLWLVSLLWEIHGKAELSAELTRIAGTVYRTPSTLLAASINALAEESLEFALQLKLIGSLPNEKISWPPEKLQRAIFVLNRRIQRSKHSAALWETVHILSPPIDIEAVLEILKQAPGHQEYIKLLAVLRDILLEE